MENNCTPIDEILAEEEEERGRRREERFSLWGGKREAVGELEKLKLFCTGNRKQAKIR
jgi:hypothetical protein